MIPYIASKKSNSNSWPLSLRERLHSIAESGERQHAADQQHVEIARAIMAMIALARLRVSIFAPSILPSTCGSVSMMRVHQSMAFPTRNQPAVYRIRSGSRQR